MYFDEEEVIAPEVIEEEQEAEAVETEEAEEDIDWKAEALKAKEIAENQRIRAEKAEKKAKETPAPAGNHSLADLRAIQSVHEDDVERLERFAKAEGLNIREAVKNPEWKAIQALREEQRNTANATNVTNVRRGSTKISDDVLIKNASAGKLPETQEEIDRLIAAKLKEK